MQASEDLPQETHLSYPEPSASREATPPATSSQSRQLLKDRLYVGNLHPTVDEYVLLQVFSKYGKVSKLDFLFHKSGPMKGKPRGYAFVEYSEPDEAANALVSANDKLLRGRKLVVTYAQQAPLDQFGSTSTKSKRLYGDAGKPTTLSLIKGAGGSKASRTDDKIAKMEAKLRQLERSSDPIPPLAGHPSLPPKPVAALAAAPAGPRRSTAPGRPPISLPALPLHPHPTSPGLTPRAGLSSTSSSLSHSVASTSRKPTNFLAGVVMKKRKDPTS